MKFNDLYIYPESPVKIIKPAELMEKINELSGLSVDYTIEEE